MLVEIEKVLAHFFFTEPMSDEICGSFSRWTDGLPCLDGLGFVKETCIPNSRIPVSVLLPTSNLQDFFWLDMTDRTPRNRYRPAQKLRWQWNINHLKTYVLLKMVISRRHLSFGGWLDQSKEKNPKSWWELEPGSFSETIHFHRIHGTGIFNYTNGRFLWVN